MLMKLDKT